MGDDATSNEEGAVPEEEDGPTRQQISLVTVALVICCLRVRFGPTGYDSQASQGTLANMHPHEQARRGVASPLAEDVRRVLDNLMEKARAGELSDAYDWVRLKVPVKVA